MDKQLEALDSQLSALLSANRDLLLDDATEDWQPYVDACVLRRRRVGPRRFACERRLRACPGAWALLVCRAALLLTLLTATLAGLRWGWRGTDALDQATLAVSFALRRVSVPLGLHRVRYLQDVAASEAPCLVPLPLASYLAPRKPPQAQANVTAERCCLCSFDVRQSKLRNVSAARANYLTVAEKKRPAPFIVTNALAASVGGNSSGEVTYAQLRQLYWKNRAELEGTGYNWVTRLSGPADVSGGLADVFADPSGPPAGSVVAWRAMHVEAARLLRRLHPRPAFVGSQMEIGLVREVVFVGAGAAPDDAALPLLREMRNVHATVLQGEALLSLAPLAECGCPAGQRAILASAGQLLFFRNACHELRIAPAPGAARHAILHIGSQQ